MPTPTFDGGFLLLIMKKSFILHLDSLEILNELTDEQAGKLLKACYEYNIGIDPKLDTLTKMIFIPFRNQFNRDLEKYQDTCEKNKLNGSKGGRPSKTQKTHSVSKNPNEAKKADNDSDRDRDSKKDKDSDSKNDTGNKNENKNKLNGISHVLGELLNLPDDY